MTALIDSSNLSGAVWDEDALRDQVRAFVAHHLGVGGVLIFDETGDLKKGQATAGVGRQYTGTAGRIENAMVAVYATYATTHGHALIDRELYVQKEWFADPERMARAGFGDEHSFATKGQIARGQARRALDAGLAPAWATGDEVYGRSSELRELFEQRAIGYVFAVGRDFQPTTSGQMKIRADQALSLVEAAGMEPTLGRQRLERPPPVRLGVDRHHIPATSTADPPEDQ